MTQPLAPDAVARAQRILGAFQVDGFLKAEDAVEAGRRLWRYLASAYPGATMTAECPVTYVLKDGRVVRGFIDCWRRHLRRRS